MNSDQVKGKIEQAVGHVKEKVGETFHDNKMANEGLGDQVKGSARETWGNVKDATRVTTPVTTPTHDEVVVDRTAETRQTVSDHLRNAKNAVNERIDEYKATHGR
jgi:uncharacterized protein YjbJ (UPF0337 family)